MKKICENCKFWKSPVYDHGGKNYDKGDCENEKSFSLIDSGWGDHLYMYKNFGCIFFEKK